MYQIAYQRSKKKGGIIVKVSNTGLEN